MSRPSIIGFARSFEKMKLRLSEQPADDLRLLILVDFWPTLHEHMVATGYRSYLDEYLAFGQKCISKKSLEDLLPEFLTQLLDTLQTIDKSGLDQSYPGKLRVPTELVATEVALKLFYVGAVEEGLRCLARAKGIDAPSVDLSTVERELEALRAARIQLAEVGSPLVPEVTHILRTWEVERGAASFDEARCLFVEKENRGECICGRMMTIHGSAEFRRKEADNDEVTLDIEVVSQDDPLVGGLYDSIEAVRSLYAEEWGYGGRHVRSRYEIGTSKYRFAGGSMGLAAALLTYVQLLRPEVMMHDRSLATGAAFTGAVDKSGRLQPVDEQSLRWKVERAFFSPIRYLVLPQQNLEVAIRHSAELQTMYPRRNMEVVGARTLRDVTDHLSIVQAEKVCALQYVTRTAKKYTRTTKVQVPLLLATLYFLICLIYPKAWVAFDWNPDTVRMETNGFAVVNENGNHLWQIAYECDSLSTQSKDAVADLDGDGKNEVLFVPSSLGNPCNRTAYLHVYESDGNLRVTRDCVILGQYPGDTVRYFHYAVGWPHVLYNGEDTIIVTTVARSNPSRTHIKLWDTRGNQKGWYVHAGSTEFMGSEDVGGDGEGELFFTGINSRYGCGSLLVLKSDSVCGVSPPYSESMLPGLGNVKQGNQTRYILFPPSDLCVNSGTDPYNGTDKIRLDDGELYEVILVEVANPGRGADPAVLYYYLTKDLRVNQVKYDDLFGSLRRAAVKDGRLPEVNMSEYLEHLRDSVRYWTDSGWVTEGQLRAAEADTL